MTPSQISLATGAPPAIAQAWTPFLQAACNLFGITNVKRQAAFLAQIGYESQGMTHLRENMNYSEGALISVFGGRITPVEASMYGRTPAHPANQEMIANIVYANRFGNGDVSSGDGWKYRGGSPIQLTFGDNYRAAGVALNLPLGEHPELIEQPQAGSMVSAMYFRDHGCNELADQGAFVAITRKINPALAGIEGRQTLFAMATSALMT